jgi:hypothetical protein
LFVELSSKGLLGMCEPPPFCCLVRAKASRVAAEAVDTRSSEAAGAVR